MRIATSWQCVNKCNVFETIGVPQMCPFCGSTDVIQHGESLRDFTVFVNESEVQQ